MNQIVPDSIRDPRVETRMVYANGYEFEVAVCGDGPRLALCLHGFPEHSISWRHQLPMLADNGYTAWAPNLRGYGNSARPDSMAAYAIVRFRFMGRDTVSLTTLMMPLEGIRYRVMPPGGKTQIPKNSTGRRVMDGFSCRCPESAGSWSKRCSRSGWWCGWWSCLVFPS